MSNLEKLEKLETQLKQLIIDSLGLEDLSVSDIDSEMVLFGQTGLGLDSVDALELGLAVQKTFNFQFDKENDNLRDYFTSVRTLANYIQSIQSK